MYVYGERDLKWSYLLQLANLNKERAMNFSIDAGEK